jgi:hypothetical protein
LPLGQLGAACGSIGLQPLQQSQNSSAAPRGNQQLLLAAVCGGNQEPSVDERPPGGQPGCSSAKPRQAKPSTRTGHLAGFCTCVALKVFFVAGIWVATVPAEYCHQQGGNSKSVTRMGLHVTVILQSLLMSCSVRLSIQQCSLTQTWAKVVVSDRSHVCLHDLHDNNLLLGSGGHPALKSASAGCFVPLPLLPLVAIARMMAATPSQPCLDKGFFRASCTCCYSSSSRCCCGAFCRHLCILAKASLDVVS